MLSRRSLTILGLASLTVLILLASSRRLGDWSLDGPYHHPPQRPPPPPHHRIGEPWPEGNDGPETSPADDGPDMPFRPHDPSCDAFPDISDMVLVMKTGASESYDKLPTQLMTMLKCLPDFLIFSDMDQHIAGYHVRDSLDTVLKDVRVGNSDFDLYRRQQACLVDQDNCNKLGDKATEGWNLDKYKNVHIAEKTYRLRPGRKWYIFVDADTYVLFPTLVQWLRRLDHRKPHYLGSVTLINDFAFGHGGSGYILSHAAMEEFVGRHPGVGNEWDERAKNECCGDYVFAMALKNATKLEVKQVWPTINGEKPSTLPFGPTHWCHPIITMHHMNSEEISTFWDYESRRYGPKSPSSGKKKPVLIKDIYEEFFAPKMATRRDDWDNLSDDVLYLDPKARAFEDWEISRAKKDRLNDAEKQAHLSFAHCRAACESLDDCYQYRFQNGICSTSWAFKLGKPVKRPGEEAERWTSGWDVKKINAFIDKQGDCGRWSWPST